MNDDVGIEGPGSTPYVVLSKPGQFNGRRPTVGTFTRKDASAVGSIVAYFIIVIVIVVVIVAVIKRFVDNRGEGDGVEIVDDDEGDEGAPGLEELGGVAL